MDNQAFPVGGSRQDVYDYLANLGFVMSSWSDKHWSRADGKEVRIFGAGSMAQMGSDEFPLHELAQRLGR